jgi:hypothetical protein
MKGLATHTDAVLVSQLRAFCSRRQGGSFTYSRIMGPKIAYEDRTQPACNRSVDRLCGRPGELAVRPRIFVM